MFITSSSPRACPSYDVLASHASPRPRVPESPRPRVPTSPSPRVPESPRAHVPESPRPKSRVPVPLLVTAPLLQCKRNIGAHKSALALTGVEKEVDLILSRASMFAPPRKIEKLNICPRHRESLGLGWRRPSSKCSIPRVLSSHSAKPRERPNAERGITKWMSEHILRENRHTCACRLRYDKLRKEIEGQNFNTSMGGKAGNSNRKSLLSSVQSYI